MCALFSKMDPTTEADGCMPVHTYYGVRPPPSLTLKKPSCACADREVFLDLMAPHSSTLAWKIPWTAEPGGLCLWGRTESDPTEVTLPFYFSRAQLLPLALSLECLGENKVSVLLHLTNTTCLAQGPICLGSLGDSLEVL